MKDCNKCQHVSITEEDQNTASRLPDMLEHMCNLHKVRVLHAGRHPKLTPCRECSSNDFLEKEHEIKLEGFLNG